MTQESELTSNPSPVSTSQVLDEALKICNYIFTVIFVMESVFKLIAFGFRRFFQDRWNQLDLAIVLLSIMGITLEEIEVNASLPINPTIIRIMRVLRIARVLKLLKMAVGMRALLDTVMQALPQVGNLGLLFMLLFFIFAALGVELFGDLGESSCASGRGGNGVGVEGLTAVLGLTECDDTHPCEGLGRHATFRNFGMAFLTLFRVSTGDNWNGIMKFVLVNVVIAVLMKHLEESNKEAKEEAELEAELEMEMKTISTGQHSPSNIFAWTGTTSGERPENPSGFTNPMQIKMDSQLSLAYHTSPKLLFGLGKRTSGPYGESSRKKQRIPTGAVCVEQSSGKLSSALLSCTSTETDKKEKLQNCETNQSE
ncbi:hypothetical protein EK904_002301 [Melospiza melodia maxima]|nr:hypothetical protein EK904_002301 [Melospiza melodia maxima]